MLPVVTVEYRQPDSLAGHRGKEQFKGRRTQGRQHGEQLSR